jgi:type I restriction enzyme R subunit
MKFTEEKLEKAFTELLEQEGFSHYLGVTKTRKPEKIKENL